MESGDRLSDRLYDVGFFLVEAFAAMEVTALLIANARITVSLGLRDELSSLILTSYLYPLFSSLIVALILSRWIARNVAPMQYFLAGLGAFAAGNGICAWAGGPAAFFAGRCLMGLGGGVAFAGQMWTLSSFHRQRITRPLVLGELGASLGVVAGPLVGALFTQAAPEGWRHFFLLNAGLSLVTAAFAWAGLRGRKAVAEAPGDPANPASRRLMRTMTAIQIAVSVLIVGAEYFLSDHLQSMAGKSPLFVGVMTVLASLGAVLGSRWRCAGSICATSCPAGPCWACWPRSEPSPPACPWSATAWPGCRSSPPAWAWAWPASASTRPSSRPRGPISSSAGR
jgi:MFS family permease